MKIIIDTLGSDKGLEEIVKGTLLALEEVDFIPVFSGPKDLIKNLLPDNLSEDSVEFIDANEKISNDDQPALAIRRKKNSSMVMGLRYLKNGNADGMISAGSTGALLAGATLIIGRIKNVDRAALTIVVPGVKNHTIMLDVGANMDCNVDLIKQFAVMGSCYAKILFEKADPSIALLNIGTEEGKGNSLTKSAYEMLKDEDINFIGNIESRDILDNDADVIVADGFAGNLVLKSVEGVSMTILSLLKESVMSSLRTKIGGALLKPALSGIKGKLDYREHGAAPLLGSQKPVFKAHGSSDSIAIKNGIKEMIKFIEADVINEITEKMRGEE
ncbi:MAG: phosphate acyltransferase PlsX [Tissierellia bacterium]|nr:phosphate acyltransferase PlsX [Tissierellia bacterium]